MPCTLVCQGTAKLSYAEICQRKTSSNPALPTDRIPAYPGQSSKPTESPQWSQWAETVISSFRVQEDLLGRWVGWGFWPMAVSGLAGVTNRSECFSWLFWFLEWSLRQHVRIDLLLCVGFISVCSWDLFIWTQVPLWFTAVLLPLMVSVCTSPSSFFHTCYLVCRAAVSTSDAMLTTSVICSL